MNEPRLLGTENEFSGGTPSARAIINRLTSAFVETVRGNIVAQGDWALDDAQKHWVPVNRQAPAPNIQSSIAENDLSFNYRQPEGFTYENRPLFLEATFIGLDGKERIKVVTSPQMDSGLKDVSKSENTYVKAEKEWEELRKLKPGEIYVSDGIGA